jgi:hypothetical protein
MKLLSTVLTETYISDTDDESAADDESNPDIPTHYEAVTCIWFEARDERDAIQLNFLKKIGDLAAGKP